MMMILIECLSCNNYLINLNNFAALNTAVAVNKSQNSDTEINIVINWETDLKIKLNTDWSALIF